MIYNHTIQYTDNKAIQQQSRQAIINNTSIQYKYIQMQCPLCLSPFCYPVTAGCGHTFCSQCLEEYFLYAPDCYICQGVIRNKRVVPVPALGQFTLRVMTHIGGPALEGYLARLSACKQLQKSRELPHLLINIGSKIDILDANHVWCQGLVTRLISRIGQPQKYIRVLYMNNIESKQEDIRIGSERLAKHGSWTARNDIPSYQ